MYLDFLHTVSEMLKDQVHNGWNTHQYYTYTLNAWENFTCTIEQPW